MSFIFDQPEVFYTINIISGIIYKNISISLILSSVLFLLCLLVVFRKRKSSFINNNFCRIILFLFLIFWTPLYINFFYNNIYDFIENYQSAKYDIAGKRIIRLCNIDHRQNLNGSACQLLSYINYAKNNLPDKTSVKIISSPSINTYLNYYTFPYFNINDKADYLLFYFPSDYYFKDNIVYKKNKDKDDEVGQYSVVGSLDNNRLILKKVD